MCPRRGLLESYAGTLWVLVGSSEGPRGQPRFQGLSFSRSWEQEEERPWEQGCLDWSSVGPR